MWREDLFKPAFAAVGMWIDVQILYAKTAVPFTIKAGFCKPDVNVMAGVQSTDFELEYEHGDAPHLHENDQVIVDRQYYRVRQEPRIDGEEATGFFRRVYLRKIAGVC